MPPPCLRGGARSRSPPSAPPRVPRGPRGASTRGLHAGPPRGASGGASGGHARHTSGASPRRWGAREEVLSPGPAPPRPTPTSCRAGGPASAIDDSTCPASPARGGTRVARGAGGVDRWAVDGGSGPLEGVSTMPLASVVAPPPPSGVRGARERRRSTINNARNPPLVAPITTPDQTRGSVAATPRRIPRRRACASPGRGVSARGGRLWRRPAGSAGCGRRRSVPRRTGT